MAKPKNVMEIFKYLDKSNCRECGSKTCLAFAGAVFQGQKEIEQCPRLDPEIIKLFSRESDNNNDMQNRDEYLEILKNEIKNSDITSRAELLGGRVSDNRLVIRVLGKEFFISQDGTLFTDIHINPWVVSPLLNYVLYSKGLPVSGNWVSFRELKNGQERYPLFQKRCEQAMKRIADIYTDLFEDIIHLFSGTQVEEQFESDVSVVLHPLPKIPIMLCYWLPDDGLESDLNIFFDKTAEENLDIGSLFTLGAGLTQMFEKLALRHGFSVPAQ
ncbi:4Fe-4S cluster protein, DUF3786 [Desulfonema limicola]|uniref:4Fe-4S cluster protein, DUF3786 n=1 Tax=Desulfonema limicola TaxID=45656 RepID=A0A975B339_9BACT|nr:DUF3786 domain-containing protein [Desulfonema limicola]QTA77902.1 4Fe-4S cluster protein, DUF3786 [Desulfonema limicola]